MPINYGTNAIGDIYYGSNKIAEVYYGSQLVYSSLKPNTTLFSSGTTGSHTFTIPRSGVYEITAVGGAGGSASSWYSSYIKISSVNRWYAGVAAATGGGGCLIVARFNFSKGTTLTMFVGSKGSDTLNTKTTSQKTGGSGTATYVNTNTRILTAGGGGGGSSKYSGGSSDPVATAGSGGTGILYGYQISATNTTGKSGNKATNIKNDDNPAKLDVASSGSLYSSYGKSSSIDDNGLGTSGTNGYIKLVYIGPS